MMHNSTTDRREYVDELENANHALSVSYIEPTAKNHKYTNNTTNMQFVDHYLDVAIKGENPIISNLDGGRSLNLIDYSRNPGVWENSSLKTQQNKRGTQQPDYHSNKYNVIKRDNPNSLTFPSHHNNSPTPNYDEGYNNSMFERHQTGFGKDEKLQQVKISKSFIDLKHKRNISPLGYNEGSRDSHFLTPNKGQLPSIGHDKRTLNPFILSPITGQSEGEIKRKIYKEEYKKFASRELQKKKKSSSPQFEKKKAYALEGMNRESPNLPLEHPTPPRFKYTYFHQRPPYYNPSSEATKTPIEYSAHLFNNGRIDQETQVSNFPSPKKQKENSPKDFTSEIYKGVKQNNINKGNTNKRRGKSLERPRGYNPNNEYKSLGAIYGSIRGGSKMQGMNRPNPRSNENTNPHGSRRGDQLPIYDKGTYLNQLKSQMESEEREKKSKKQKEIENDRKIVDSAWFHQYFGRGGGGAPLRDHEGKVITERNPNMDNIENPYNFSIEQIDRVTQSRAPTTNPNVSHRIDYRGIENKQMNPNAITTVVYKDYGGDQPPSQKQQYKDELLIQIEENKAKKEREKELKEYKDFQEEERIKRQIEELQEQYRREMEQKKRRMGGSTQGMTGNLVIGTTSRSKTTSKRAHNKSSNYSVLKDGANSQIYDQKHTLQISSPTPREKGRAKGRGQPIGGVRGRDTRQGEITEGRRKDSLESRLPDPPIISDDYLKIRDQLHIQHWNLDNQLAKLKHEALKVHEGNNQQIKNLMSLEEELRNQQKHSEYQSNTSAQIFDSLKKQTEAPYKLSLFKKLRRVQESNYTIPKQTEFSTNESSLSSSKSLDQTNSFVNLPSKSEYRRLEGKGGGSSDAQILGSKLDVDVFNMLQVEFKKQ